MKHSIRLTGPNGAHTYLSHRGKVSFAPATARKYYAQWLAANPGGVARIETQDREPARRAADAVRVMFRKWPAAQGGEVLALFPEIPADVQGLYCQSYAHTGQHGAADPQGCIRATRPATVAESAALIRELESAPFHYSLRIIARTPADAYRTRRAALNEITRTA